MVCQSAQIPLLPTKEQCTCQTGSVGHKPLISKRLPLSTDTAKPPI